MQITTITMTIITMNTTREIVTNTSKIIIKDKIIEMINIIMEIKSSSEKIYINTKIKINMNADLIKIKRGIIRSLISIASRNHIVIINIQETITNIQTQIAIINIELGKYIILN